MGHRQTASNQNEVIRRRTRVPVETCSIREGRKRAWQDSNLRHTAPETLYARLQFDEKLISTRFLSHHLRTISCR
jgi:hypothetical protein